MIEFERVTTRGGDRGETSLYNGERRRKDDLLFETMGDVDELSSQLGVAKATCNDRHAAELLAEIQRRLIAVGAQVATPKNDPLYAEISKISNEDVEEIERIEASYLAKTKVGSEFVLPGASSLSAHLDVSRAVCRRAERKVVACIRERGMIQLAPSQRYLNRLSDLLFVLARHLS